MWSEVVKGCPPAMLGKVDTAYLEGLCRWWSIWRQYEQLILDGEGNQFRLITMAQIAWSNWSKAAAKFGLTPVDRQRLRIAAETGKQNPLEELKARRKQQCGV
jgi:phage terminase small subunit